MGKEKIIYLGKKLALGTDLVYRYQKIDSDRVLGEIVSYGSRLFRKGTIGSIYEATFEGDHIRYNKSQVPTSYIEIEGKTINTFELFPKLFECEELNRQAEERIMLAKRPKSPKDMEIEILRSTYKNLPLRQRESFIGNLIYKITK